jgi:hypothetical protein
MLPDFLLALRNRQNVNISYELLHTSTIQPLRNLPKMWSQFTNENIKIIGNKIELNNESKKNIF